MIQWGKQVGNLSTKYFLIALNLFFLFFQNNNHSKRISVINKIYFRFFPLMQIGLLPSLAE